MLNLQPPLQKVTRIPPWRPGMWVVLRRERDRSRTARRVRSLTAAISTPGQQRAVWRVHFDSGDCCEWHEVERLATAAERRAAGGLG